jgi:hypothetical protein
MTRNRLLALVAVGLVVLTSACAAPNPDEILLSKKGAVELRAMQSRAFSTADRPTVLRAVIATLQDLGYTIEKVEPSAGTVSALKLAALRLTATVYERGSSETVVRANALVRLQTTSNRQNQVDDPEFYQKFFFEPLSKALFLTALQVEDTDEPVSATPASAEPVRK